MLKNFNNLLKSVILQQVTQDKDQKFIKLVYHCNQFYNRYLVDLAGQKNVAVTKQRNNTFLVIGSFSNIINYFNALKVDEMFMENPKDFTICAPMYTFNDPNYQHNMQRGQMYAPALKDNVITTHDVDNIDRTSIYGRWYNFKEVKNQAQNLLKIQPNKFKKYILEVKKQFNLSDDDIICIEFSVNCEDWKNNIFEDMAQYRTQDQINQKMADETRNIEPTFKYENFVKGLQQPNDQQKKVMRNIKNTKKNFKSQANISKAKIKEK